MCAYIHLSGDSLLLLEEKAMECYQCDAFQNQETSLIMLRTTMQLVHNLTGRSEDPLKLSGDFLKDETDILARAAEVQDEVAAGFIHFYSLLLAYVFNDFEAAAAKAGGTCHIFHPPYLHPTMSCPFTFHALALLAVCNQRQWYARRKTLSIARQAIKKLEKFSTHSPENCSGKMYLLQAELAAATGKHKVARCKYASAVGVSSEFGDKMVCAIASERAGRFFQGLGDQPASTRYYRKARSAYKDWGATAKVEQLEKDMAELFSE
jgi:hypothetical protein